MYLKFLVSFNIRILAQIYGPQDLLGLNTRTKVFTPHGFYQGKRKSNNSRPDSLLVTVVSRAVGKSVYKPIFVKRFVGNQQLWEEFVKA